MIMTATVLKVENDSLLVKDMSNGQEVRVLFGNARNFSRGDVVVIFYNGAMTHSLPPQITAISIQMVYNPGFPQAPSQPSWTDMRAVVIDKRDNSLLVRDLSNNSRVLVRTPHARFFCSGQRVIVRYDAIRMTNPPEVNAIDVLPDCR